MSYYSQAQITADNQNPCPGEWITFTLPTSFSGCSNFKVTNQYRIKVSPLPPDTINNVLKGYSTVLNAFTHVSVRYPSYQSTTISVQATGSCTGVTSATAYSPSFVMKAPLNSNPTINGPSGTVYSNDSPSILTAGLTNAPAGTTYSWQLVVLNIQAGSISAGALSTISATQSKITWPTGFVGDVKIVLTATSCNVSTQTEKTISVLYAPEVHLVKLMSIPDFPDVKCKGTEVQYGPEGFSEYPGSQFMLTNTLFQLGGGGQDITTYNYNDPFARQWKIRWNSDGFIKVTFTVSERNGTNPRTWTFVSQINFDVTELVGGQISQNYVGDSCSPIAVPISVSTAPSNNNYSFQYCNAGACDLNSSNWTNNSPVTSSTFSNISTTSKFRIKLNETRCGVIASNDVTVSVKPTPKITLPHQYVFSGDGFGIPGSDVDGAQISATPTQTGVSGAVYFTGYQVGVGGIVTTQFLKTTTSAEGSVVYSIQGAKDQCFSVPISLEVTVYPKPTIISTPEALYRGMDATLSLNIDGYDSYQWLTQSGSLLGNLPTYKTSTTGGYKVAVTKNGAQTESLIFHLGNRLDGLDQNFVTLRQPLQPFTSTDGFEDKTELEVAETINYFDGFGRPIQTISTRSSPSSHDMVQPFVYDQYGREAKKYLPYVSVKNNGRYQQNADSIDQLQFYRTNTSVASDSLPFAETVFEDSPLNRVVEQGASGKDWKPGSGHTITKQYLANKANDVAQFNYDVNTGLSSDITYYQPNALFCNKTTDEQQHNVLEFVDKQGRTICKKVEAGNGRYASTYYVYDKMGNLVVVLPPEAIKRILNEN